MAPPEDPRLPDDAPADRAASPGRFWQRYSGREEPSGQGADTSAEPEAERRAGPLPPAGDYRDLGADASSGETTGSEQSSSARNDERANDSRSRHRDGGADSSRHHAEGHQCLEWCPICRGAELLREAVPPELQEQFKTVQRDALLMAQAMIQAHLERLQREARDDEDPGISSIPID